MNLSNLITKRNLIILMGIFAIISIALWLFSLNNNVQIQEISYTRISMQYPLAADTRNSDKTVVFSNNRSFVAYNPSSGEVSQLTSETTLPTIGTILMQPNDRGALFQTVNQTYNDNLAQTLTDRGLDLDQPYWWYVDFASNSYQLVTNPQNNQPAKFRQAAWIDNSAFVGLTSLDTQTQVSIFSDFKTLQTQYIISGALGGFAVRDGKITYQNNTSIMQSDLYANSPTSLLDNVSSATFSPTNDWAFVYEADAGSERLTVYLYNLSTKQKIPQGQTQEAYAKWSKDGSTLFVTYQGNKKEITMKSYNVNTQKEILYKSPDLQAGMLTVLYAQDANLFVPTDFNNIYLASDNQNASKFKIPDNFKTITKDNTTIEYFATEGYFIATTFGPDTQETRKMIADQLRANGVTPELVQINYIWQGALRDSSSN